MEDKNNTFNACSHLVEADEKVIEFLEAHKDIPTLEWVFTKQLELQTFLEKSKADWYLPSFDSKVEKTTQEVLQLIRFCKLHFDREYFELEDSLGGMSRGLKEASSIAKPWKAKHTELLDVKFKDLSEDDKNEVRMEFIDMLHFIAMLGLALGIDNDVLNNTMIEHDGVYTDNNNGDVISNIFNFFGGLHEGEETKLTVGITCGELLSGFQDTKFDLDATYTEIEREVRVRTNEEVYEYITMLVGYLTMGYMLELTSDDIKYLYTQKNLENFDRQERGY